MSDEEKRRLRILLRFADSHSFSIDPPKEVLDAAFESCIDDVPITYDNSTEVCHVFNDGHTEFELFITGAEEKSWIEERIDDGRLSSSYRDTIGENQTHSLETDKYLNEHYDEYCDGVTIELHENLCDVVNRKRIVRASIMILNVNVPEKSLSEEQRLYKKLLNIY